MASLEQPQDKFMSYQDSINRHRKEEADVLASFRKRQGEPSTSIWQEMPCQPDEKVKKVKLWSLTQVPLNTHALSPTPQSCEKSASEPLSDTTGKQHEDEQSHAYTLTPTISPSKEPEGKAPQTAGSSNPGWVDQIHIKPGAKVLYLGATSGTTVSHVSDIVGPDGLVYAVEFSYRSGRDLINLAKKRTNIIPVIEDAQHPHKYRMLIAMVDVIFADVAQPDQTRIVALNAHTFLRNGGHFVIPIKANCIDSTASAEAVFASEVKMQQKNMKPQEQLTLEHYERDHAVVVGVYRPPPKVKN
ncbi:hypothetical protein STEG23_011503 [Scotinomys teguina]